MSRYGNQKKFVKEVRYNAVCTGRRLSRTWPVLSHVLSEALTGEMETDNILHSTGLTLRTALAGCLNCKNVLEIFLKFVL